MCVNCNDSLQVNLPIGPAGENGVDGQSAYLYIASASALPATSGNFSYPLDPADPYISVLNTTSPITTVTFSNFTTDPNFTGWHSWTGPAGANGINGTNGIDGINGAFSFEYLWNTNTAASDPGYTFVKLNNNTNIVTATQIYISHKDKFLNQLVTPLYYAYGGSNSVIKSFVTISKRSDSSVFATYRVLSGALSGAYYTLTVVGLSASSLTPFSANDDIVFSFSVVGDVGATGATGATGAIGPQGPAGPVGSVNLTRPGSANISATFDTELTTAPYTLITGGGDPAAGQMSANITVDTAPSSITVIKIAGTDSTPTNNSATLQAICSGGTLTMTPTLGGTASTFTINQVSWDSVGNYVLIYVSGGSGANLVVSASTSYNVDISTDYQVILDDQNYNLVYLKNNSGIAKNVRFKKPTTSSPGDLLVVEVEAATANANNMLMNYVYNTSGATTTLTESNRAAFRMLSASANDPLNVNTATQKCIMQFYATANGLAYIGGDQLY